MKKNRTKRILSMLLTLCMVLTLVPMTALAADTYTLTIVGGTKLDDGETSVVGEAGSGFDITANEAPEGKVFDKWVSTVSGVLTSPVNSTTWFKMPAQDVTVTATYKNEPETDTELKDIEVNVSKKSGWETPALTPAFDRETRSYALNLTAEYVTIYFYLSKQVEEQTITATVDGVALTGTTAAGGFQTTQHTLTKATTVFDFTITAKDGSKTGTYTVTVNRGSGITNAVTVTGGTTATPTPADGDTVTITANEPAPGKVFDKWTTSDGITFANANSATTTFVMPTKAVTVTATYKNDPETDTELKGIKVNAYKSGWQNPELTPAFDRETRSYSLNLTSEYDTIYFYLPVQVEGQTITATVDGNPLTVNTALNGFQTAHHTLTKATTVFDFTITAKDTSTTGKYTVTVNRESGTTHAVTVTGGTTATPTATAGDTVTITANEPETGKVFDKWTTTDGVEFANENNATTTFTMPAKAVTVAATYKDAPVTTYAVTVNSGTGGGNYAAGATVSITANAAETGKVFDKWTTSDGVTFGDENTTTTTFVMPAEAVTVTATYKDAPVTTYAVTVNSGTGSGNFAAGATVTITANEPETGKVFDKWTTTDGVEFENVNNTTTTFVMPANDVAVTATYKDAAVDKAALTAAITAANSNKGTATVSTDGTDVDPANKWVTTEVMTAYTDAIAAAQTVVDKADATQTEVDNAVTALATATTTFDGAKKVGTKPAAVVKTALTDAISAANTNKGTATVSTDGTDVDPANKWVTTEAMTAYEGAITTAQAMVDKADATQAEVDAAVTALGTATTTFDGAKKVGTKPAAVVKTALTDAISAANTNKGTATVSTDGTDVDPANKWVTTEAMTAYEGAITTAQAMVDKADATQAEVDAAVTALGTATTTFDTAKADGTKPAAVVKTALTDAISAANTNKGTATVSTDGTDVDPANKWVTTEAMTAYEGAITTAQAMVDKADATQAEVDAAVTALATATSTFNTAKADGTDTPVTTYAVTVNSGTGGGNYAAGATVRITANAPETGKVFDKWTTTDGVTFGDANSATTTFVMPAKAVTVTATYKDISSETPDYKIIAGESGIWKKDNTKGIVIISNGDYSDFTGVIVDDIFIDPSNYTSAAGSTVVTLKPAYLETLAVGTHIVTLQFGDYSVQTNLTILADDERPDESKPDESKPDESKPNEEIPKTGESNHTLPLIGLLLLSGSALIGVTRNKKKKKSYNK